MKLKWLMSLHTVIILTVMWLVFNDIAIVIIIGFALIVFMLYELHETH